MYVTEKSISSVVPGMLQTLRVTLCDLNAFGALGKESQKGRPFSSREPLPLWLHLKKVKKTLTCIEGCSNPYSPSDVETFLYTVLIKKESVKEGIA